MVHVRRHIQGLKPGPFAWETCYHYTAQPLRADPNYRWKFVQVSPSITFNNAQHRSSCEIQTRKTKSSTGQNRESNPVLLGRPGSVEDIRLRLTDSNFLSPKLSGVVIYHWGRHLNRLDPVMWVSPKELGRVMVTCHSCETAGCNGRHAPLMSSSGREIWVWCSPGSTLTGWPAVYALRMESEAQSVNA